MALARPSRTPLESQRLTIAPAATGCKRLLASVVCLHEALSENSETSLTGQMIAAHHENEHFRDAARTVDERAAGSLPALLNERQKYRPAGVHSYDARLPCEPARQLETLI